MIENIRKYNILIIIGLVVVAAGLVITMQTGSMRNGNGAPYLKIGSRTYTDTEYRHLGVHGLEIARDLSQQDVNQAMRMADNMEVVRMLLSSGPFPTYQFIESLSPRSMYLVEDADKTELFFINRMIVRKAMQEFGIHPNSFSLHTGQDRNEWCFNLIQNFSNVMLHQLWF